MHSKSFLWCWEWTEKIVIRACVFWNCMFLDIFSWTSEVVIAVLQDSGLQTDGSQLASNSILARLTDHTATPIDHIYTNCLQNFTAGILTVDITDLPVFCKVRTQPTRNNSIKKYFRDYSKFNKDLYF